MQKLIFDLYRLLFARAAFYKFHKLLYQLCLRGIGILNYESDKLSGEEYFVEHHVSKIREGVVLDVGANVGKYSKLIKKMNQDIAIFAFEPHPATYQKLVKNVDGMNMKTYNVGVGASEGSLYLYDYADKDGSPHASLYKDAIEQIHKGRTVAHKVRIVPLDAFVIEHNIKKVGLLKIDTEGHELEVLKGFERCIRENKVDLIHFEFNEMNIASGACFKDFWDFLPNYDLSRMLQDGLVPIREYNPVLCEIYAYQNIVAKLKAEFTQKDVSIELGKCQ